jgi:hypothetical protein
MYVRVRVDVCVCVCMYVCKLDVSESVKENDK